MHGSMGRALNKSAVECRVMEPIPGIGKRLPGIALLLGDLSGDIDLDLSHSFGDAAQLGALQLVRVQLVKLNDRLVLRHGRVHRLVATLVHHLGRHPRKTFTDRAEQ